MKAPDVQDPRRAITAISIKAVFDAILSIAMLTAAVMVIWTNLSVRSSRRGPALEVPKDPIAIDGAAVKGSPDAPTVMVLFSDFECPYCGRLAREILPTIERDYVSTGRMSLIFSHFPLPNHPHASAAAKTAECAGKQGRFWAMHDALFTSGSQLDQFDPLKQAAVLQLDVTAFEACLMSNLDTQIASAVANGVKFGIKSTPSVFIGTRVSGNQIQVSRVLLGARPIDEFRTAIEQVSGGLTNWRSRILDLISLSH